jgi:DNA-binding transcriptional LysR family regulator
MPPTSPARMKDNSQNQLKLSQLKILVAVADHGTFSEAALQLDMSQSAVSHSISAMEEHLGVVLLVRGRQGAKLTPVGSRILEHARVMLHHADAITLEADLARGLKGGSVRVASFRSIAIHLLPLAIAQFNRLYPQIVVNLSEQSDSIQVEKGVRAGNVDIGLTLLPAAEDLETWPILDNEYLALFPPDVPGLGPSLAWPDLAKVSWIMPPANRPIMQDVQNHLRTYNCRLNIVSEVETATTIVSLVAQGMGATILPRLMAEPIPPGIQVFSLPVPLVQVIGAAVRANALHNPAVYALLDVLRHCAAEPHNLANARFYPGTQSRSTAKPHSPG